MMLLLDKLSNANKDIMSTGGFTVNLINCNDDKSTNNFFDAMLSHFFLPFITTTTRVTRNTKTIIENTFIRNLLIILCLEI